MSEVIWPLSFKLIPPLTVPISTGQMENDKLVIKNPFSSPERFRKFSFELDRQEANFPPMGLSITPGFAKFPCNPIQGKYLRTLISGKEFQTG